MLKGYIRYSGFNYDLEGYDFEDSIAFYLETSELQGNLVLDNGILYEDGNKDLPNWSKLYISIGNGDIKVDCYLEVSDGVKYKNSINKYFFSRFGSIIRGLKQSCNKESIISEEEYGMGFNPKKVNEYRFENEEVGYTGYVQKDMQSIKEFKYSDDEFEIYLVEDGTYGVRVFPLTDTRHKVKLDLSDFIPEKEDDGWDFSSDFNTLFSLEDIIKRNPDKNYDWLRKRNYKVVSDIREVESICKKIWKHNGIVSFDTETTGLYVNITSRSGIGDRLVGMVFSISPGEAWYFPVKHKKFKNICNDGNENYIIEKYFKPILEKKELLCFNGAYDWKVMHNYNICANVKHDAYILFKITMWNDNRSMKLGLKSITKQILNRDSFELSDFTVGKFGENNIKFWDFDEESTKYYACPDTDNLIELYECATSPSGLDLLNKYGARKVYEMEVAFSIVIAYQEYYGHCVDVDRIPSLVKDIEDTMEREYKAMVELAGHDFNPNSSGQTAKVMFEELGYPIVERTDTGNPSTGKGTRKKLMSEKNQDGTDKYPLARHLHNYAEESTLQSNFTKNLEKFATEDGLCFSEVNQFLETGRVSVNKPNYQSYSDTVKQYIVPRTGYYAMDADYSSVEARIMVSMAGCNNMVEKLKDPDMDYHTAKASDMFGVPYELVSSKLRKMSKGVNFGILYGLGDWNLGVNLYGTGSEANKQKAQKQKELYFKGMEELRGFIDKSKSQGREQHYSTTFFGRRRYYDPRKTRIDTIERQSCNARIQGTAADIYKLAMIRLFNKLRQKDLLGKVLISAFVHDECFLEVHKSIDPCKMLKMLRECMMLEIEGWCPLFIGCGYGRNWYEAKKTELPVQVQDKFVNEWGDKGLDWWDGDGSKLYEWEINQINDYKRDRVINFMKNEENWNGVLKPVENSLCYEVLEEVKDGIKIHGALDVDFIIDKDDMINNLREFSKVFGCLDLFEKANLHKPVHEEQHVDLDVNEDKANDFEVSKEELLKIRINTMGIYTIQEENGMKLYFKWYDNDPIFMKSIYEVIKNNPGNVEVLTIKDDGCVYKTNMYTDIKTYPKLLPFFIRKRNIVA